MSLVPPISLYSNDSVSPATLDGPYGLEVHELVYENSTDSILIAGAFYTVDGLNSEGFAKLDKLGGVQTGFIIDMSPSRGYCLLPIYDVDSPNMGSNVDYLALGSATNTINGVNSSVWVLSHSGKKSSLAATVSITTGPVKGGCHIPANDSYCLFGDFTTTTPSRTDILTIKYDNYSNDFGIVATFAPLSMNNTIFGVTPLHDGTIVVYGSMKTPFYGIRTLLHTTGAAKISIFYIDTGVSFVSIYCVKQLPDIGSPYQPILVGGRFKTTGTVREYLVKYTTTDTTATVDSSFICTLPDLLGVKNFHIFESGIHDGKILVSYWKASTGVSISHLGIIDSDGTYNTTTSTFHTLTFNGTITSIIQTVDGTIVVGGDFTTVDGIPHQSLAMFTETGTLL
jgi:hypothetical protein